MSVSVGVVPDEARSDYEEEDGALEVPRTLEARRSEVWLLVFELGELGAWDYQALQEVNTDRFCT